MTVPTTKKAPPDLDGMNGENRMTGNVCIIEGCRNGGKIRRGLCNAHYLRNLRNGSPTAGNTSRGAPLRWLRSRVGYVGSGCLTWPFALHRDGYGNLKFDGSTIGAHRLMCEFVHGPAPTGNHQAAHSCGNGHLGCVNPRHLRWATPAENANDKAVHAAQRRAA